jgi:PAS domain S-box-containing protein
MISPPFLRSSASRGLLLVLGLFVVAIATLGVWFFGLQKDHIRTDARNGLQVIADLKVESIRRWRQERLGDAQWIFEASNFPSRVRDYLARGDDEIRRTELVRWMEGWRRTSLYSRLLLLDPELQVRLAVPAVAAALEPVSAAAARTALRERRIVLADLHRESAGGVVAMDLLVPLVVGNGSGIPVGVLVFEIDPSRFIFPHIQTWPTPSKTGETLLVRRDGEDVVYLNTLRHRPDTALKVRVPTSRRELPAVRAALGEESVVEGVDYRDEPVLAALRAVPDSPWFLVAKQDLAEIDAPVRQWAWLVGGAVLVLTGAAATGTGFLWRTREVHHSREQMAERVRSEAALRESKARLDLALDAARMGVWRYEVATQRRDYDERACRLLGIDRASFDGTSERFYQHLHPADRPVVQAALKRTIEDGAPYDIAYRAVWADGTVRHLAARGTLERDDTGRPRRLNGLLWDVTEMRLAEEAARAGEAELRALYAAMTEMVAMHEVVTDAAGRPVDYRILDCNAAYERITGIPRARAVGTLASELYGTGAPPYLDVYARVGLTGEPTRLETYFPPMRKHFSISVVSPERGRFATVTDDITERKHAEQAIREASERLIEAQRIAGLGSYVLEVSTGVWTCSAILDEIFGIADPAYVKDVAGWLQIVHPEDREAMGRYFQQEVLGARKGFDRAYRIVRLNDGAERWVQGLGELVLDAQGEVMQMIGMIQDITERKRADEALRASEALLNETGRVAKVGGWKIDLDHGTLTWTREVYAIHEVEAEFQPTVEKAIGFYTPESRVVISQAVEQAIAHGEPFDLELEVVTARGRRIWVQARGNASVQRGKVTTVSGTFQDITERRELEMERELLLHELGRKNEELEGMLYVASHDLRAPLVNVQGFGERLQKACAELVAQGPASAAADVASPASRIVKALGYIRASAGKMDGLINGLLRVSRVGRIAVNPQTVDLERLLRSVLTSLKIQAQQAGAAIEIGPLPPCRGDPQLLGQVVTNLLDNALKYRDPARPLRVTVSGRIEGREVFYCVADTGMGIAAEHQNKIWEMFHRLHPEGPAPGEGLGLKIVRRILDRHHGRIWVESQHGMGSRFFVALPLADKPGSAQETPEGDLQ